MCDFDDTSPYIQPLLLLQCPAGANGYFIGETCYQYIYCSYGEIIGTFECSDGMYFDVSAGGCLDDISNICPRYKHVK